MNQPKNPSSGDIKATLGLHSGKHWWGSRRLWWGAATILVLAALAFFFLGSGNDDQVPRYQTTEAHKGDLTVTVSATGTLAPTNEVEVGSEVSGTIENVYVDVNDRVKKGQLLATLDVSKQQDAVAKARATLAAADATVLQKQATLAQAKATLARYRQVAELSGGKVPSKQELDTAAADVQRAIADEASAKASVLQAQASLRAEETTLAKAYIHSPINGVVLTRKVDPGQTVAAAMQTPVLFTLAEDLSKMELQVDVDEADVGNVKDGQSAVFTVDAWPNRKYEARVTRVSFGSQTTDKVVSYLTTLQVDNKDLSLRPGMTATAEITTVELKDVLLVPNAALRFSPTQTAAAAKKSGGLLSAMMPRPPMQAQKKLAKEKKEGSQRVWVLQNGEAVPVDITVGYTNGSQTQVTGGDLRAGMQVITDTLTTNQS